MWQYILYFNTIADRHKAVMWIRANYEIHSDDVQLGYEHYTFYRTKKLSQDNLLMLVNSVQASSYLENEM